MQQSPARSRYCPCCASGAWGCATPAHPAFLNAIAVHSVLSKIRPQPVCSHHHPRFAIVGTIIFVTTAVITAIAVLFAGALLLLVLF